MNETKDVRIIPSGGGGASCKSATRQKIDSMLDKIEADDILGRIYSFIKYIYIHQTLYMSYATRRNVGRFIFVQRDPG